MFYTLLSYLKYSVFARYKYGHGIHSPFLYDFIVNILNDKTVYPEYLEIEKAIEKLKNNKIIIEPSFYGANVSTHKKLPLAVILRKSSVPLKYRKLLFRLVRYYKSKNILELGTCCGISTSYLSKGKYVNIAKELLEILNISNVHIVQNTFENSLPNLVTNPLDLVFFDGNHTYDATIWYFEKCLRWKKSNSIFVFDDIYWSKEMNNAWKYIVKNKDVRLSVDLFRFGVVFFNENILSKQHYIIRY